MAVYEDGSYSCLPGVALIGKVLAGRCTMHYTRAAVGKGYIPEDVSPKALAEPPGYVMDAKIVSTTNPVDGECQVTVQVNSSDVETGFFATSLLLYAADPDLGEVPYTYLKIEDGPEWIRPASSAIGKLATFDLIAAVGDVKTVTAAINPEAIATNASVDQQITEHDLNPNAHAGLIAKVAAKQVKKMVDEGELVTASSMKEMVDATVKTVISDASQTGELVTRDNVVQIVQESVDRSADAWNGSYIYIGSYDITIPVSGWIAGEDENGDYSYICDVLLESATSELIPDCDCNVGYLGIANDAQILNICNALDGYLRFYAKTIPTGDILSSVSLYRRSNQAGNSGSSVEVGAGLSYGIDGRLNVNVGDGLSVNADNELTVDQQTVMTNENLVDEDATEEKLKEILLSNSASGNG